MVHFPKLFGVVFILSKANEHSAGSAENGKLFVNNDYSDDIEMTNLLEMQL